MKNIMSLLFIFILSFSTYAQLSGDIVKGNRKPTNDQKFIIEGHTNGKIVFEIAVDEKGKVTSTKVLDSESTIKSTPAKIQARNHVANFTFEPGTWFPKYHQGRVVITMIKPK